MTHLRADLGTAFIHSEDNARWVRVNDGTNEWDEPLSGWERLMDLVYGGCYLRDPKGRMFNELHESQP